MALIIAVMVVMVAGLNFLIERSGFTRSVKSVFRIAVLCIALSVTYYWIRTSGAGS